ncbi:hypothetical protein CYLTODRAFT_486344 [Cylindrobasidium torrendii FP15055 ss-10]|uniref:Uncharacterized protein n=1 Tax=Cylindrobasidium torrendii FP15055 ss-10 TaxID=1314674 RepID=A0A0D7BSD1_9AGAR|nr:hypothetical protein CYLTODRAFT_486344 [Cylindrobasidium torrendii FP15055 ss-10]
MLALSCASRLKAVDADGSALTLRTTHHAVFGTSGPSAELSPGRFPDGVDVLLAPNFHFLLSGKLNGKTIAPHTILRSHLARHLHAFLNSHKSRLGLADISDFAMDADTALPSLLLTGNHTAGNTKRPHLLLTRIDLCYQWTTNRPSSPFAKSLALPFLALLDNIVARFVTWHLVKRYPLAFGTWYTQLNTECALIPKILRSILSIVKRSHNQSWRTICRRYLKNIQRQQEATIEASMRAWLPPSNLRYAESLSLSIEEAFCLSMEDIYRLNVRKPLFKVIHVRLDREEQDTELCPGASNTLAALPCEDIPLSGFPIPIHDNAFPAPQNPDLFAGLPKSFSFLKDPTAGTQDIPVLSAPVHPPGLMNYASSDDDVAKSFLKEDRAVYLDTHENMVFDDNNDSDMLAALCDDALEQDSDGAMLRDDDDDDEAILENDNQVFYDSSDVLNDTESMLGSTSDDYDRPLQFLELFDIDEADLMGFDSSDSKALDMFDEDEDGMLNWDDQKLSDQRNKMDVDGEPGSPDELEPAEHDMPVLEDDVTPELTPDQSQSSPLFDDALSSLSQTKEPIVSDVDVGLDDLLQRDKGHDYPDIYDEDDDILADDEDDLDDLVDDAMGLCGEEKDWMLDGEAIYEQRHVDVFDEL